MRSSTLSILSVRFSSETIFSAWAEADSPADVDEPHPKSISTHRKLLTNFFNIYIPPYHMSFDIFFQRTGTGRSKVQTVADILVPDQTLFIGHPVIKIKIIHIVHGCEIGKTCIDPFQMIR